MGTLLGSAGEFGHAHIQSGKVMRNKYVINFSSSKKTLLLTVPSLPALYNQALENKFLAFLFLLGKQLIIFKARTISGYAVFMHSSQRYFTGFS